MNLGGDSNASNKGPANKSGSNCPHPATTSCAMTQIFFLSPPPHLLSHRRDTINNNLWSLTLEQRLAFGLWYSEALSPSDISGGRRSLITDTGNLIAYLPFHIFQHLSPAQVIDL